MLPTRPNPSAPAGALTLAERARLAELTERLRLAHDLALAFADRYAAFPVEFTGTQVREVTELRALLDRYPRDTWPAGLSARLPGRFADPAIQRDFDRLAEQGRAGRAGAVRALTDALFRVRCLLDRPPAQSHAPDVHDAYRQLLAATARQLRAVQVWGPR